MMMDKSNIEGIPHGVGANHGVHAGMDPPFYEKISMGVSNDYQW
jgi:hypothetical protein